MRRVLLAAVLVFVAVPAPAQVSPGRAREVAHEAASQLRSPVTPSHTLDMCPAPEAEALRDTVLMAATRGMTAGEIVEGVIARRGEQLRIVPKREGFGIWAWILPPAVLLAGLGVVSARLRAM
ncbi:MAG TPA: cytochrome c-type biogenesis protein CcmH, partial [Longimicrobiaceae bacterium]|nr:cytochrome c-type biogenesis protein CcmH [Longimicrobiaceae bacterium]